LKDKQTNKKKKKQKRKTHPNSLAYTPTTPNFNPTNRKTPTTPSLSPTTPTQKKETAQTQTDPSRHRGQPNRFPPSNNNNQSISHQSINQSINQSPACLAPIASGLVFCPPYPIYIYYIYGSNSSFTQCFEAPPQQSHTCWPSPPLRFSACYACAAPPGVGIGFWICLFVCVCIGDVLLGGGGVGGMGMSE
jgi:hypothetical protein